MANIEKITLQLKKFAQKTRADSRKSPTFALHNFPSYQQMKEFKEAAREAIRVYSQILQEAVKEVEKNHPKKEKAV